MSRGLWVLLLLVACESGSEDVDALVPQDARAADARAPDAVVAQDAIGFEDAIVFADADPEDAIAEDLGLDAGFAEDAQEDDAGFPEDAEAPDAEPEDTGPPPMCGNNQREAGEDCDDGNTTDDGNGCSATCTRVGSCGNGIVEALFESCDPGLSACCAADCSGVAGAGQTCRAAVDECDAAELCDGSSLDCPADQFDANGSACTMCPSGANCAGCFQGSCLDSRAFCADILARGQSTGNGVYTIRPSLTSSAAVGTSTMSAYCDMATAGGGWTMIYKKSRLAASDGAALWNTTTATTVLSVLNRTLSNIDYSSGLQLNYWPVFSEARIEVVTGTITQKFIHFNLQGSTRTNWFSPTRHTASSWTDLPTSPTWDNGANQAFRIGGGRSFYINRVWNGCPNDRGWVMISTINVCEWENRTGNPADIIYSRLSTESHIPTPAQTGFADTFVIFVR